MTDNSDGTYSYPITFNNIGKVNFIFVSNLSETLTFNVEMQSQGKVDRKNYDNSACTSNECPCIVDNISFYDGSSPPFYNCDSCIYTSWINNCATIKTNIFSPVSSTIAIKYNFDDAGFLYIDGNECVNDLGTTATLGGTCSFKLTQRKYYSFSGEWNNKESAFHYRVNWNYTGSYVDIPSAYLFLPSSLPGSPFTVEVVESICGDSIKTGLETCDDQNIISDDGCNSTCQVEVGWTCSGGSPTSYDTCDEICGDGKRFNSNDTYCDDGNTISGDGCTSTCQVEHGWNCTGGSNVSADVCTEICGDGIRFNSISTYCDDGNLVNNDGCSSTCAVEYEYLCTGGSTTSQDTCKEICGDGIKINRRTNYCDDGNLVNGDGCNSTCAVEYEYLCTGGSLSSQDNCKEICGDGIRINKKDTYCDDGNLINGDGCNSVCNVELRYMCTGGDLSHKDICYLKQNATSLEASASLATQTAVGVSIGATASVSLLTMSSPIGIFSMINQFQLLLLLLVTGVFVSTGLYNMITGMNITLCNFDFIKIEKIKIFQIIYEYLSFVQPNVYLNDIGIVSGSTFINVLKMILVCCFVIVIHILFLPIYYRLNQLPINSKLRKFGVKIIDLLTYTIYVRLVIQFYVTILLSSFSELYEFKISTKGEIASFCINVFVILLNSVFFLLCAWQTYKAYPHIGFRKQIYFTEFFNGIKNRTFPLFYPIIFLALRSFSCILVIIFAWLNLSFKIAILSALHSAVAIFLLITRPFEETKDSIFEGISQTIMAVICIICIYYNTEERSNPFISWICIAILMTSSIIVSFISIFDFGKIVILKIRKCWSKNKDIQTSPKEIKNEENKHVDNNKEQKIIEENKDDTNAKPYSKVQLKNNRELYVQDFEYPIEISEEKSPTFRRKTSFFEITTSNVSKTSSKMISAIQDEISEVSPRRIEKRRYLRDNQLP